MKVKVMTSMSERMPQTLIRASALTREKVSSCKAIKTSMETDIQTSYKQVQAGLPSGAAVQKEYLEKRER